MLSSTHHGDFVVTGDNIHLATDCAFGEKGLAHSYRDHKTDVHFVTPDVDMPQRVERETIFSEHKSHRKRSIPAATKLKYYEGRG